MIILRSVRFFSRPPLRDPCVIQRPKTQVSPFIYRAQRLRPYATTARADEAIDEIQELYATAKDEFEIAAEETEKKTVYAADDRAAAQEELKKLKDTYQRHIELSDPDVRAEIQRRVGQRIRELDNALTALEEMAMED